MPSTPPEVVALCERVLQHHSGTSLTQLRVGIMPRGHLQLRYDKIQIQGQGGYDGVGVRPSKSKQVFRRHKQLACARYAPYILCSIG